MGFLSEFTAERLPRNVIKKRLLITTPLGITCFIFILLSILLDPVFRIVKYNCRVDYGTFVHDALKSRSEGVHLSTYLFNVTNAELFQSGIDAKLQVEEIGPFTYQEVRTNELLEIDNQAGVIRYMPKITTKFLPEESIGDPREINVTMPNIALLSMASKMGKFSFVPKIGFNLLASRFNSKAIVNINAADYLWGYDEPLIRFGNTVLPGLVNFNILGILDRLYDKKANYYFEVSSRDEDKFVIKSVNKVAGLEMWSYKNSEKRTICNSFTDTYEGIGYPIQMTPDRNVRIYRNILCRILELDFHGIKDTEYGIKGLVYKISNRTFTRNNATECLCSRGICQDGVSDLSPCFLGLPIVLSNAHFTGADPDIYRRVEGIKPDEDRFGSSFVIEPKIGMALETKFSVQVNVKMEDASFNSEARKYSNMIIPIAYFKVVQPRLPEKSIYHIKLIYFVGPALLLILQILLALTGLGLLSYSVLLVHINWFSSKRKTMIFEQAIGKNVQVPLIK